LVKIHICIWIFHDKLDNLMKPFFTSYHKCGLFSVRLLPGQSFLARVFTQNEFDYIKLFCFGSSTVPNEKVVNKRTISGNTACQQVVTMLLCYQVAPRLSLTTCWQIVELQDDNKLLDWTTCKQVCWAQQPCSKLSTSWEQAVRTHPVEVLLEQHWYKSAAGLLQLVRFTCVH
jgi:hypothetical protein